MNGSNEGPCGSDSIYQYSNASVSSSSTTGDVDEAAFLQGGLQRPERILDPTSSGIVLATNASRSDSLYHNEIQHQPSSFTPASFNSTETSLIGISPNGYDDRYFTSVGSPFYDWFPDDFSVLECLTQGDQHLINQQEQRFETNTQSQGNIRLGSKIGNRSRPRCDECDLPFYRNSELKRHQQSIHHNGGYLCGDCRNEGANDRKVLRKDHFLKHLREKHGFSGSTKPYPTCSFGSCQPENQHQKLCFTTEHSLNLHLQIVHGGASQSSGSVSGNQLPSSTGPIGNSGQILNSKRTWQETLVPIQDMKRLRSSTPISDSNLDKETLASSEIIVLHTLAQDNAAIAYGTPESGTEEDITCYIENVSAYEFIRAKSRWNQISELFSSKCWVPGSPFISYDAPRRRIRLCVRTPFGGDIIASVIRHLDAAQYSKDPVLLGRSPENRLTSGDQHHSNFHLPITTYGKASDSAKVFPIRRKEDSLAVNLWNEFIIPALPKILDEPMKTGYTACLVRKGATLESATPIIRIESPQPPGKSTKENILAMLDSACVPSLQSVKIRIQFCTGSIVYLSGEIEEDEENCEESGDRPLPLPLYNTYWEHAGMGASIGLLCTNTEFATLGCYLNVDGEKFILTVDHFIQKSYESLDKDREGDRKTLTSPAIAKVRSIKTLLENSFSALEADLQAKFGPNLVEPADLDTPSYESIVELASHIRRVEILLQEHQKKEIEYKIGSLSYRCESGSIAPLSRSHSTVKQDSQSSNGIELGVRLDWAVFAVDPASSRKGRNRYRQNHHESGSTNFFLDQAHIGEGEGEICRRTCVVEGNEQVRFVGGHNGSLEGQVNGTLQVVRYEERTTLEHHIVMCSDHDRPATEHAGASGTMVVKVPDNEILGMVWACNKDSGQPVFTPIHTIFEDIRKVMRAENVNLDQYPEPEISSMPIARATASNIILISGSERDTPKLAPLRPSDFPQLVLSSDEKARLFNGLSGKFALRPKDHSVSDAPLEITAMDRSQMQAPSLSSSRASSPGSLPPTPVLKSIELRSTANCARDHISIIGEDTGRPLAIDEGDDDVIQGDNSQTLLGNYSATENRLSIQFLLSGGQQKSLEHLFSPTPSRRWNTWPIETGRSWNASVEEPSQLEVIAH